MLQHMLSQEQMLNEEQAALLASARAQCDEVLAVSVTEAAKTHREVMTRFSSLVAGLVEQSEGSLRDILRVLEEVGVESDALGTRVGRLVTGAEEHANNVIVALEQTVQEHAELLSARDADAQRLRQSLREEVERGEQKASAIAASKSALVDAEKAHERLHEEKKTLNAANKELAALKDAAQVRFHAVTKGLEEELAAARDTIAAHGQKNASLEKTLQADESELKLDRALLERDREELTAKNQEIRAGQRAIAALEVELESLKERLEQSERVSSARQKDAQQALVLDIILDRPFSEVEDRTDTFSQRVSSRICRTCCRAMRVTCRFCRYDQDPSLPQWSSRPAPCRLAPVSQKPWLGSRPSVETRRNRRATVS